MIEYKIIETGSSGNAVVIQKNVLVDCGVAFTKVEPYLKDIKLVLLTHRHSDHFKVSTLRRMALEKPLLRFGCGAWMVKPLVDAGISKTQIDVLKPMVINDYGIVQVLLFPTDHDVPNCGYKMFFPSGKVFYATDLSSTAGIVAKGYDLYLIEANYVEKELKSRLDEKMSRGEYAYEARVQKYHLSKEKAENWVYKNMSPRSEYVFLHCHVDRGESDEREDS